MDLHHELPASQTGVQNYLHLESMASVIGLAPIRPGLKDRLLELLCIHGLLGWAIKMVPEVGIAPTSPRLQRGADLPQLLGVLAHDQIGRPAAVTLRGLPLIRRALCS